MKTMRYAAAVVMIIAALNFSGCAGMSGTQQRTMSGSLIGGAAGAGIAAIAGGNPAVGLAVGAATGGLTGLMIGE